MIRWMRSRLQQEEGFTLVELMVVVLIIAILIAIAIPTFLGARQRAQDRGAQSNLRNALTAEKVFYTDEEEYALHTTDADGSGLADLAEIEPSLTFSNAVDPTNPEVVNVLVCGAQNEGVALQSQSSSGTIFTILDVAAGAESGTFYQTGAAACTVTPITAGTWAADGW